MKISGSLAYIGPLFEGSTTKSRMESLASLGWDVAPFDITPYRRMGNRLTRSMAARLHAGHPVRHLNADLQKWAQGVSRSVGLLWIDKGTWVYPETLAALKRKFGCPALHYTPDAQINSQRSRHFLSSLPLYDYCVTTKEWEVGDYRDHGARCVLLTLQGYADSFDRQESTPRERVLYASGIGFVGHYQAHYAGRLRALAASSLDFRVWGDAWHKRGNSVDWLRGRTGPGLFGESYPAALRCATIGLGLLGKHIPETSTTRSFEIPAVGTFLLAERTDKHRELFEEGREAEFFGGDEELADKARFYLENDEARTRIANAGYERCRRSGYSSCRLLSQLLSDLEG
jgi:hypothetical protein